MSTLKNKINGIENISMRKIKVLNKLKHILHSSLKYPALSKCLFFPT